MRLDAMDLDFFNGIDRETWHDVLDMLHLGDRPPEEEKQPNDRECLLVVDWITA